MFPGETRYAAISDTGGIVMYRKHSEKKDKKGFFVFLPGQFGFFLL